MYVMNMFYIAAEDDEVRLTVNTPLTAFKEMLLNTIEKELLDVLTPENWAIEVKVFWEEIQLGISKVNASVLEYLEDK